MNIRDMDGNHVVRTFDELDAVLLKRHLVGNAMVNSFWLSYGNGFPCMLIMVSQQNATIWYASKEGEAGYASANTLDICGKSTQNVFYFDKDRQEVSGHLVVTWAAAAEAAAEFLKSGDRPQTIRWIEL